jgi:hypothetical protein
VVIYVGSQEGGPQKLLGVELYVNSWVAWNAVKASGVTGVEMKVSHVSRQKTKTRYRWMRVAPTWAWDRKRGHDTKCLLMSNRDRARIAANQR